MKTLIFFLLISLISTQSIYAKINKKIYKAIKLNHMKTIKHLINKRNVNQLDSNGETILNYAIINGNIKIIKYLVKQGININKKSKVKYKFIIKNREIKKTIKIIENNKNIGDTPLIVAIKANKDNIAKFLITLGAKINLKNNRSNTPLNTAIKNQNIELIKYLIKKSAQLNPKYESWNTPLIVAIETQNLDIIKLLVKHGANINTANSNDVTPLYYSFGFSGTNNKFTEKKFKIVKYLINNGAKLEDNTLYNSIRTKSLKLVDFLIKKGATLSKDARKQDYEFKLAAKLGTIDIFKKLLNLKNTKEVISKAFFESVGTKNNNKMVNYLISLGVDVNYIDDKTGKNILIKAIESNDIKLVKLIVSKGGNVNFISKYGYTPLMAAINNLEITKYLIENKARVNLYNPKYNQNLLSYAISMGNNNNDVIKYLIKKRASIKNTLYNASIKFNEEIIKILISKNVKINKKHKGDTPLNASIKYAVYNIHNFEKNPHIKSTISLLISKGGKFDKDYLESQEVKKHKKLYKFIKSKIKKL